MSAIGDLTTSMSILLGVLTFFLTVADAACERLLGLDVPGQAELKARGKLRQQAVRALCFGCVPLLAGLAVLLYVGLPTAVTVIRTSRLSFWEFEPQSTLFVLLEIGVLGCFCYAVVLTGRIARRWHDLH